MENGKVEISYEDFMDLMEEKELLQKSAEFLEEILELIFNNVRLGYKQILRIDEDEDLMTYLKIKEKYRYENKVKELLKKETKEGE